VSKGGALLLAAGAMPSAATTMVARFSLSRWLPGRRSFAVVMAFAGAWWMALGLGLPLLSS
jgi:hypothetical protein